MTQLAVVCGSSFADLGTYGILYDRGVTATARMTLSEKSDGYGPDRWNCRILHINKTPENV